MKLLSAISTLLLLNEATSQAVSCPNSIDLDAWTEVELEDELLFKYAIVLSPSPEQSIMCARLESEMESYIGFGISPSGDMEGQGIIGSPDIGVQKYNLSPGFVTPADKQTLMSTSITQSGGQTIMEFAKYLSEDGEIAINPNGKNEFLWAIGSSNALGYHAERDDFTVQIQTSPLTVPTTSTSSTTPQSTSTSASTSSSSTSSSTTSSSTSSSSTASSSTTSSTSSEMSTSSSQASSSSSLATPPAISSTGSICLTEEDCREASDELGLSPFLVGTYPTKGCFTKNGKAYFSPGTEGEMSTDTFSGSRERVYCDAPQTSTSSSSTSSAPVQIDLVEEATSDTICLTEEECAAAADTMRMVMIVVSHSTKGCFSKNSKVFWSEGPESDMAIDDLPGIRKRVYCGGETETAGTQPAKSSLLLSSPSSTSTSTTTTSEDFKITKSSIGDSSKSIQQAQAAIEEYSGATMKTKVSMAVGILLVVAPLMV